MNGADDTSITLIEDARALRCPLPLLKGKQALNRIEVGQKILLLASDPSAERDIQAFVGLSAHTLIDFYNQDGVYHFVILKGK